MSDDGHKRITLRIPDALHVKLTEEATSTSKSMNAEIIARLQGSFTKAAMGDASLSVLIEQVMEKITDQAKAQGKEAEITVRIRNI